MGDDANNNVEVEEEEEEEGCIGSRTDDTKDETPVGRLARRRAAPPTATTTEERAVLMIIIEEVGGRMRGRSTKKHTMRSKGTIGIVERRRVRNSRVVMIFFLHVGRSLSSCVHSKCAGGVKESKYVLYIVRSIVGYVACGVAFSALPATAGVQPGHTFIRFIKIEKRER